MVRHAHHHLAGGPVAHHGEHLHDHRPVVPDDPGTWVVESLVEQDALWELTNVELRSVGIDVGSAGVAVVFSTLHLRQAADQVSSRFSTVARSAVFRSAFALTPFRDGLIDEERLKAIVDDAYAAAGLTAAELDTGAVILTGEAGRRENAAAVMASTAARAGSFVCSVAGHQMEAVIAAYGSGAAALSAREGRTILNIDVGGGTAKYAVVSHGEVVAVCAAHVGSRLIAWDDGVLTRVEPAALSHARRVGVGGLSVGERVAPADLDRLAEGMAEVILALLRPGETGQSVFASFALMDPAPLRDRLPAVDGVMFSGGVAEFLYGREERDFGDLGPRLGRELARLLPGVAPRLVLLTPQECLRATVVGAAEHTVQLSGNTTHLTDPAGTLPRRDLKVVRPLGEWADRDAETIAASFTAAFRAEAAQGAPGGVAFAMRWSGPPEYIRLRTLAEALRLVADRILPAGDALYAVVDADIAMNLGRILVEELGTTRPMVILDGLRLSELDHIDIGELRYPSGTVPVTIKSLVINGRLIHDPAGRPIG